MCGRFTLTVDLDELRRIFNFVQQLDLAYTQRYNIAPGQEVLAVTEAAGQRRIAAMRWGLIPSWAKEERIGYSLINARAETIGQKPAFREAFYRRRCLIPADGFFEWKKAGREKQPFRIVLPDKPVFAFAGLWDKWRSPEGKTIISCCIVTTEANAFLREIHERMPVILADPEVQALWLQDHGQRAGETLGRLLQPYEGPMAAYPVAKIVNSPHVDGPECIAPLAEGEQGQKQLPW